MTVESVGGTVHSMNTFRMRYSESSTPRSRQGDNDVDSKSSSPHPG